MLIQRGDHGAGSSAAKDVLTQFVSGAQTSVVISLKLHTCVRSKMKSTVTWYLKTHGVCGTWLS